MPSVDAQPLPWLPWMTTAIGRLSPVGGAAIMPVSRTGIIAQALGDGSALVNTAAPRSNGTAEISATAGVAVGSAVGNFCGAAVGSGVGATTCAAGAVGAATHDDKASNASSSAASMG